MLALTEGEHKLHLEISTAHLFLYSNVIISIIRHTECLASLP